MEILKRTQGIEIVDEWVSPVDKELVLKIEIVQCEILGSENSEGIAYKVIIFPLNDIDNATETGAYKSLDFVTEIAKKYYPPI